MKKKIIALVIASAFSFSMLTACTAGDVSTVTPSDVTDVVNEVVDDVQEAVEDIVEDVSEAPEEEPEEAPAGEGEEVPVIGTTPLDTDIEGTWKLEGDEIDTLYITYYLDNGTGEFTHIDSEGNTFTGVIYLESEETQDGTEDYWFNFYVFGDEDNLWEGVNVPDDAKFGDDLFMGQGGEPHYIRTSDENPYAPHWNDPSNFFGFWDAPDGGWLEIDDEGHWAKYNPDGDVIAEGTYLVNSQTEIELYGDDGELYKVINWNSDNSLLDEEGTYFLSDNPPA